MRSGEPESQSSDSTGHVPELIFITHIRATDVASDTRRLPPSFYVAVRIDGKITKTSNKPIAAGQDILEWNEEILLPPDRSSVISFNVYASFQIKPGQKKGVLLCRFSTTVAEVLDRDAAFQRITFLDKNHLRVRPTLNVITERRACNISEPTTKPDVLVSGAMSQLAQLTDAGNRALLRYRERGFQSDLHEAITSFARAQNVCSLDCPDHFLVLFNLATVRFIDCQDNYRYHILDVPIKLYWNALQLHHPEGHSATALDLCFALLARLQRRGHESTGTVVKDLSPSVAEIYAYRAAWLALQMAGLSLPARSIASGPSQAQGRDHDEESIRRTRAMLQGMSDWDPRRPTLLGKLGGMLYDLFHKNGKLVCIHEAISLLEKAVQLTPDRHPNKPALLNNLGSSLGHRFNRLGDIVDANRAVSVKEDAVRHIADGHPCKPAIMNSLASSLWSRFERLGDLADVNKSISITEEAVRLTPDGHPDKSAMVNSLGSSLLSRFDHLGNVVDLDKAVTMFEEAVHVTPDGDSNKPLRLNNLGNSLLSRFERLHDVADLDKSISTKEESVYLTPDGHRLKPGFLHNLGSSFFHRFEYHGNLGDLDKSISSFEEAVHLTPVDHPDRPVMLNSLGSSFLSQFEHLCNLADLDKSISMFEEALCRTPEDHPDKPTWLNNLGNSLFKRFKRLGDLVDIDRSISMMDKAVCLTPDCHPDKPARLNGLGDSLLSRFVLLNDLVDIDKSISMFEEMMRLTPDGHSSRASRLNNLGNALFRRFERLSDLTDLNKSISMFEDALHLTPDGHCNISAWLNNLSSSLFRRFQKLGDLVDINKSILISEEAVYLTPNDDPEKPAMLNNLGTSLCCRFQCLHNPADINKSILVLEEALCLIPSGNPNQPSWLNNLGNSVMQLFGLSHDPSHLSVAVLYFSLSSQISIGPTFVCFNSACHWISAAKLAGNSQAVLEAYSTAINLLPQLAWSGLPLTERHHVLVEAANIAQDAAAAALHAGHPEKAMEWLEEGRSIVWNQLLQLRAPINSLQSHHPTLAHQFQKISEQLEQASFHSNARSARLTGNFLTFNVQSHEEEVQRHHDLALKYESLLAEIRALPEFDQFLLPKKFDQLAALAHSGPVVYLSAGKQDCNAFIIMEGLENVIPVSLSDISYIDVQLLQGLLHLLLERRGLVVSQNEVSALIASFETQFISQHLCSMLMRGSIEDNDQDATGREGKVNQNHGFPSDDFLKVILAVLWNTVTVPILEALGFVIKDDHIPKQRPHIFWCSTGPFAFLPIHAAGLYDRNVTSPKIFDYVISSYIPTLSALMPSAHKHLNSHSNISLLAVSQPKTDGLPRLPAVIKEIYYIKSQATKSESSIILLESDGTVKDVKEKMKQADWVHFACHGVQDPKEPLKSGLCLANKQRLMLSDIIQLSRSQGGIAFLSACQTAQGHESLLDESVHLAAGMLLAGYDGVVATMWSIMDDVAPKVTEKVYEHLFQSGKTPDSMKAAEALHYAVEHLRDSGTSLFSWIPFIHVGR